MTTVSSPYAVLDAKVYVRDTRFTMYGSMPASDGTCDRFFSGTLYF